MASETTHNSRASLVTLCLLAGVAALWVYAATRQTSAKTTSISVEEQVARRRRRNREIRPVYIDGDNNNNRTSSLHRTRSIRRQRRQQPLIGTRNNTTNILETLDSADANDIAPSGASFARRGSRASLSAVGALPASEEEEVIAREMASLASEVLGSADTDKESDEKSSSDREDDGDESDEEGYKRQIDIELLHLIGSIAGDHARRSTLIHRGTACYNCKETPIRGVRYRCAQCGSLDLCESCEAHGVHQKHLLLKVSVPLPPLMNRNGPLIRQLYPGTLKVDEVSESIALELVESTYLTHKDINNLYSEFCVLATKNASGEATITRETFYQCLGKYGGTRSIMASRLFAYYDADNDNELTFREMAQGFSVYNKGTLEDKAPYIFRAYDVDGDGRISRDDMRAMLEAFAETGRRLTNTMLRSVNSEAIGNPYSLLPDQPLTGAFSASVPDDVPPGLRKETPSLRSNLTFVHTSTTPSRHASERLAHFQGRGEAPSESEDEPSETSSNAVSVAATTSATIGTVASARLTRHRPTAIAVPGASTPSAAVSDSTSSGLDLANGIESLLHHSSREHSEPSSSAAAGQSEDALSRKINYSRASRWPNAQINEEPISNIQQRGNQNTLLPRTVWHDSTDDHEWSIIEALNQDATRIMTDEVFAEANPKDPFSITYNELLAYLRRNSNLVSYIEVLGPIF
ncbi:hypothetical protein H4217_003834 [Coemansia sp. RSA 1939]|nr:hypothetical protein H4217_003834 [Coemansia sp. RSA 1939]KAJ2610398.1 hypothetical protein EV177_003996 [Coemansia sp. RSA 1804]